MSTVRDKGYAKGRQSVSGAKSMAFNAVPAKCAAEHQAVSNPALVGKGMTVAYTKKATLNSKHEPDLLLKAENGALQQEVQYLRQLLSLSDVSVSSTQKLTCPSNPCKPSLSGPPEAAEADHTAGPAQAGSVSAVQLKREELLKMKCAQMERQVIMLQAALQSRSQVTAEAENILSELTHGFTLLAMSTTQSSHAAQAKAMELLTYSQEMLSRLSRLKLQTSLSQARSSVPCADSDDAFSSSSSSAASANWEVPFFAASGHFMDQASKQMGVTDLCRGQGVLLANPTRTQLLESELASLAPRLSSLTVLMRTAVLPVMSLTNPEAAKRLQVEVAETAEVTAQAANGLTHLSMLLPGRGVLFGKASCHAVHQDAAVRAAGRCSNAWSCSSADGLPEGCGKEAAGYSMPSAKRVMAQLPGLAVQDRAAASRVLTDLLDRRKVHEGVQQQKLCCMEEELHYLRSLQASQAEQVSKMFSAADDTLSELDPAVAEATLAAADALRRVLEAQGQLNSHRSEVSLKQLIAVLRETSPELQQACWLLVSQQEAYKSQVSQALNKVKMDLMNAWQAAPDIAPTR